MTAVRPDRPSAGRAGAVPPSRPGSVSAWCAAQWNNPALRAVVLQAGFGVAVIGALGLLAHNALVNMATIGITSGFEFLGRPANFAIGETPIAYSAADSYGRAILVGLVNTIKIAAVGCVLTTLIGTALGVARLSSNELLRALVQAYIELIRNIPLLLQLFFWYAVIQLWLPGPRLALAPLPGVFLSNRGMMIPALLTDPRQAWVAAAALLGLAATIGIVRLNRRHQRLTGQRRRTWPWAIGLILAAPALVAAALGAPLGLELPKLTGFNFVGGASLSPEFTALLTGLTLYSAAFVAEIVRSGIQSVSKGQIEAARALGLAPMTTMRLIILPQALRVIVPPLTSSYLTLTKNSSLAVAIGYPDLVSVVNTTMNQTGQAVETVAILMAAYLTLSLGISALMNWYNASIAIRER